MADEESPGKLHRHTQIEPSLTRPNSSGDFPASSRPKPDFVSVLSHIAPFEHGLRRAGVLNQYDYARLRMACKTTAELLKPYPYNPRRQDTKDPYFAGLRVTPCDQCHMMTSDRLLVKPCYGHGCPNTGGTSACGKFICISCVFSAHLKSNRSRISDEVHYCRPCSQRFHQGRTESQAPRRCQCGWRENEDVRDQPSSEWLCFGCRSKRNEMLPITASHNVLTLEVQQSRFPLDRGQPPSAGNLKRWIGLSSNNRNDCPGCGIDYAALGWTWMNSDSELDGDDWPRDMVRQCVYYLEPKPPVMGTRRRRQARSHGPSPTILAIWDA
ncbi:uncharacterized protein A1O5_06239 [Cladophialophora psammophila CBS 110553]|uniref:Uncharacterized protein n=1 Tax=Cladophialophora psammophila CBS 110553 TaxID=1182543 RepID=W9WZR4_9EURO|nr:uncharacterized protein A1O5_06239 [Cladophialophora psammophila CBS 110553]EXJ70171.1 hypothetical protein A1O5_06239 [Cladophialophora psammophila CBS 110553]